MIRPLKDLLKRHWPALSLRTILFGTLLFVAALPGVAALFLRVYENTIVQQTEAELVAQGAVLASAYKAAWRGGVPDPSSRYFAPEPPTIDLRTMPVLPAQPERPAILMPDPRAAQVGRDLLPMASDAAAITLTATRLLDAHGTVVLGRGDVGRNFSALPEVRAALAGSPRTVLRERAPGEASSWLAMISRAAAIRVHHARPVIDQARVVGVVMLSRTPRGLFVGLNQDRGKILLGIALIFGTLLALAGLLSRGIARPIDALAKASEDVARGHIVMPETPTTAATEIAALYANFRAMAERIERRARYLKDFAAAVSHEFKTPLAGIRGAIELLDEHGEEMDAADRRRFLGNAGADADRLGRLVQRLLDLARADMATIDTDARADVTVVARRVADSFRSDAFVITVEGDPILARVTPEAIETLLETLVENSRQAGAARVAIAIGEGVTVTVDDDGLGIAEADRERIFEPFFTGRREQGGAGLGLAIAHSLLAASGGSIEAERSKKGARFVIRLAAV